MESNSPDDDLKIKIVESTLDHGSSEQWLKNFCDNNDCPRYADVMQAITSDNTHYTDPDDDFGWSNDGGCITFYGTDAHCDIPDEFWEHVEIVTGKRVTNRPTYFSCSC